MAEGEPQITGQTELPDLTVKKHRDREASFNMYEILAPDFRRGKRIPGRFLRWEAEGRKRNPNGELCGLTIDRVDEMMRKKHNTPK